MNQLSGEVRNVRAGFRHTPVGGTPTPWLWPPGTRTGLVSRAEEWRRLRGIDGAGWPLRGYHEVRGGPPRHSSGRRGGLGRGRPRPGPRHAADPSRSSSSTPLAQHPGALAPPASAPITTVPLMLRPTLLAALTVLGACAPAAAPVATPTPAPATAARRLPESVRWARGSAEHRALYLQVYAGAGRALDSLARGRAAGSWAVILDADETIIDNSEYQRRRALLDSAYTDASWSAWVAERAATPLPGAADFLRRVRALGGRVVIVTNRTLAECDDTRANLAALQLVTDLVLCRSPQAGGSDKNARFAAVQAGSAAPDLPPLDVLLWVGDNIQDFPDLTQAVRDSAPDAFALFGQRYFILPNPMYGSWDR